MKNCLATKKYFTDVYVVIHSTDTSNPMYTNPAQGLRVAGVLF